MRGQLMRCDIHQLSQLSPRQLAAWRELAVDALVPNPFAEPEFVIPAARWLRAADAGVLVVDDGADWLAAAPVLPVSCWRRVPGRCLTIWRHPYCFLGTPLLAPARRETALAALLRRATRNAGTTAVALEWVDADGPFGEALASVLPAVDRRPVVVDTFERAALHRRPQADYIESTVSARHRKELRRSRRLLEAEVGAVQVLDRAADEDAPLRFLELEQSGWKGRAGTAMARDPNHARLFVDLCRGWAREGSLQLLALQTDERVISMKCNVRAGDGSFCFKIAFDEALARFSPGVQLELANVAAFHGGDAGWMDSCAAPENGMINRLWEGRRRLQTIVISSAGLRGAVSRGSWRAACAGRDMSQRMTRRSP